GAGIGVVAAGDIGAATSWRFGLAILALPSVALAWAIHRYFPEPARGGQSRLVAGAEEMPAAGGPAALSAGDADGSGELPAADEHPVLAMVQASGVEPARALVLTDDADSTIGQAIRWVITVPTNLSLILASSLGYFFLSGVRIFALIYARGR